MLSNEISKESIAKELKVSVPDITRKLKALGLPFTGQFLDAQSVAALRVAFGAGGGKGSSIDESPRPAKSPGEALFSAPSVEIGKDSKTASELAAVLGCSDASIKKYAQSADAAWRPHSPVVPDADGRYNSFQVAMITDARQCIVGQRITHAQYIAMRAAWLDGQVQGTPSSIEHPSENSSDDECDFAGHVSAKVRHLEGGFDAALDSMLDEFAEKAVDQISVKELAKRANKLIVRKLASRTPLPDDYPFTGLLAASGRITRRFTGGMLAGLLKGAGVGGSSSSNSSNLEE